MKNDKKAVKHTPGPWHVDNNDDTGEIIVRSRFGVIVCNCEVDGFGDSRPKEDARLIAAAPDLRRILSWIVKAVDDGELVDDSGTAEELVIEPAREILKRTKGAL